ncbi:MAG TPA: hypothetical protein VGQ57_09445 [Polyangiaceae bacterium]|nr:hypothetical protein [Polyangiaceae bacterium]
MACSCCSPNGAAAPGNAIDYFYWTIAAGAVNGNFFSAWNGNALGAALAEPNSTIFMPRGGLLRNLRLATPTGANVGADQTAFIRVNGINIFSATIAAGQHTGSSGASTNIVLLFDRVSLIASTSLGPLIASLELG